MYDSLPSFVLGFHGCDKAVGLDVLNGHKELLPSTNNWDWLGTGIYFWEQDASLAYEYAKGVSTGEQFAKGKIKTPFVLGAIIDLRSCWNLPTSEGTKLLKVGYNGLKESLKSQDSELPINKSFASRSLDRAVIEYIHSINKVEEQIEFDTVRGAFEDGLPVYPGTNITQKNHIQICVRNKSCIKGYFLPRPLNKYNPKL